MHNNASELSRVSSRRTIPRSRVFPFCHAPISQGAASIAQTGIMTALAKQNTQAIYRFCLFSSWPHVEAEKCSAIARLGKLMRLALLVHEYIARRCLVVSIRSPSDHSLHALSIIQRSINPRSISDHIIPYNATHSRLSSCRLHQFLALAAPLAAPPSPRLKRSPTRPHNTNRMAFWRRSRSLSRAGRWNSSEPATMTMMTTTSQVACPVALRRTAMVLEEDA